jgi:flagellar biosynthesis protein FliP
MKRLAGVTFLFLLFLPLLGYAAPDAFPAITVHQSAADGKTYSVTLQILAVMSFLTVLPALLMTMTSFTRIIIVMSILRQAIGLAQTPSNQILIGISLFLSLFIMSPVLETANTQALQPYLQQKISAQTALSKAQKPFRDFMMNQTRTNDLEMFMELSGKNQARNSTVESSKTQDLKKVPMTVLMPAFLTSELKTAFQIGFMLFLPFLIIDLVVASVLMSMGMMMLSPLIISLPFKIMLFVLVDGWTLVIGMLSNSFGL